MRTATATIYQSSDLNQRGRAVLDEAREGFARVRDKDGVSLVMTREDRFDELTLSGEVGAGIALATASFMLIERAVDHEPAVSPSLAEFGDWIWARYLPAEDLHLFVKEIREALYESCREFSLAAFQETLDDWRETALALRDDLARETLLGSSEDADFVDAARPEGRPTQRTAEA